MVKGVLAKKFDLRATFSQVPSLSIRKRHWKGMERPLSSDSRLSFNLVPSTREV